MASLVIDRIITKARGIIAEIGFSGDIIGIDWRIVISRK